MSDEPKQTEKPYLSVCLSESQLAKLHKWEEEQDAKVVASQKGTRFERYGLPYYGASGGGFSYHITPTGLGLVIKVSNNLTGDEIDLTEYNMW